MEETGTYGYFKKRFEKYDKDELIKAFNDLVGNSGWTSARANYSAALIDEFKKRGFDISEIEKNDSISFEKDIFLEGNIIKKNKK